MNSAAMPTSAPTGRPAWASFTKRPISTGPATGSNMAATRITTSAPTRWRSGRRYAVRDRGSDAAVIAPSTLRTGAHGPKRLRGL